MTAVQRTSLATLTARLSAAAAVAGELVEAAGAAGCPAAAADTAAVGLAVGLAMAGPVTAAEVGPEMGVVAAGQAAPLLPVLLSPVVAGGASRVPGLVAQELRRGSDGRRWTSCGRAKWTRRCGPS